MTRGLGEPRLTTADAVGQAMAVGPAQAVGFTAFLIAGAAGGATPFVVLTSTIGALSLVWAVSLYARRYAGAGTVYEYVVHRFGRLQGVAAAGAYFAAGLVFILGGASGSTVFWQRLLTDATGSDPGFWPVGLGIVAAVVTPAYLGVRLSVRMQLVLTAASVIPFAILAVAVVAQGGASGNTLSVFSPTGTGSGNVFRGLLLAALLFSGFEMAAALGEESRRPHSSIPRAMLLTVALCGGFFIAVAYAGTIGLGPENVAGRWGGDPLALVPLGHRYAGGAVGKLVGMAIAVDLVVVALAATNAYARGVFTLARDGLLPRKLASVSRHSTPVGGILVVAVAALLSFFIAPTLDDPFDLIRATSVTLTLTLSAVYLFLVLGAFRFGRGWQRRAALLPGVVVTILGLYGSLVPFPDGPSRTGLWLALGVGCAVGIWVALLHVRRPDPVARAGDRALLASYSGR